MARAKILLDLREYWETKRFVKDGVKIILSQAKLEGRSFYEAYISSFGVY